MLPSFNSGLPNLEEELYCEVTDIILCIDQKIRKERDSPLLKRNPKAPDDICTKASADRPDNYGFALPQEGNGTKPVWNSLVSPSEIIHLVDSFVPPK